MAIYWVDPYLDTPNGGIHGTTGTGRTGTYSNPFGYAELYGTSANPTSIGGTALYSTDEIRLKGQSLSSYYTNIGTTGNKVPITSCPSSGDALVYASSYNTNVDTWRTALTTANSSDTVGVFVIHDPDLLGTEKWTIASSQPGTHTTGQDRIKIQPNNNRSPYSAYFGALEGITSSKGLEVSFIDPAWYHDFTQTAATYYLNFINTGTAADGLTYTDGWDSETTRNGVTLLILRDNNTNSPNIHMWNMNGNVGIKYDLPNTVLVHYHTTQYYHNKKYYFYWRHVDETYSLKLGGIVNANTSAWNYMYLNSASHWLTGGDDYSVDIRFWAHSRYFFWNTSGNSSDPMKIRVQNMFWGHSPYFHGNYHDLYVGNIFMYGVYTGADFFYTNNRTNTINILANAHLYGSSGSLKGFDTQGSLGTVGSGVTTTEDQPAKYPGAGSGGPTYAGVQPSSRYFVDMDYSIPLAPVNWYDAKVVKAPSNTATISTYDYGHWNTPFGTLQCDSDYNNINSKVNMVKNSYINQSYFSDQSMQFVKNTHDNKPIMLWTHITTGSNTVFPALISYNDSDDMIVKCTNQTGADNKNYFKSFVYDTPELTGMNTLVFQQDIMKIGTGVTTAPTVRLYPVRKALAGTGLSTSATSDSTKWTFTYTFSANTLDSDVNFIGSTINMHNNTGADKNSGIRIKPPVFTVT